MSILTGGYVTLSEAAKRKGVKYGALQAWLRRQKHIQVQHVGKSIVVRYSDLDEYKPLMR